MALHSYAKAQSFDRDVLVRAGDSRYLPLLLQHVPARRGATRRMFGAAEFLGW